MYGPSRASTNKSGRPRISLEVICSYLGTFKRPSSTGSLLSAQESMLAVSFPSSLSSQPIIQLNKCLEARKLSRLWLIYCYNH